ncbi:zinc finger protein 160-like [Schistocerca serialis cubense]|uniref:zinc finger protein 160-like n=1 Tax=Schistocerca serialis cubense TaxID=2023355 RepID=UPI00214EDD83|nr:zinc finger protein 160-like [Schistocerca serialis cubense]
MIAMHFVTDEERRTVKFEQSLYCRTEAMDQEPTMWIKKEETDEVQTELCFMFLVDPLKTEGPSVGVKQDSELKLRTDGSEHNSVKNPLGISRSTDFIKEDPELYLEMNETENIFLEDPLRTDNTPVGVKQDPELQQDADLSEPNSAKNPLGISRSTDFIKEDPELNLEMNETETIVETSTRYASDSARLSQTTGGSCGISCEETCHHGLVQDELVADMEKSTHKFGTYTEDVTVNKECSVATQYDCSMREKELHVYSCNFCQQSFPSKYRFIKHVFMHIDGMQPPLYVCKWCGEVFNSNVSLKKHLRMSENYHVLTVDNHERYDYTDEHQSSIFLNSEPEVFVTELNELNPYKETGKAANKSSNDVCNIHMTNDAEKTNDYGTLCTTVNVSAQVDLLTAKKTDKRGICGKLITVSGDLKRKSFLHTVKRPHKCEICGKSFSRSGDLNIHTLNHTGKKPHECDICGKSFTMAWKLKTHSLIHTEKKPHKCELCGKSFALSGYLKKHETAMRQAKWVALQEMRPQNALSPRSRHSLDWSPGVTWRGSYRLPLQRGAASGAPWRLQSSCLSASLESPVQPRTGSSDTNEKSMYARVRSQSADMEVAEGCFAGLLPEFMPCGTPEHLSAAVAAVEHLAAIVSGYGLPPPPAGDHAMASQCYHL